MKLQQLRYILEVVKNNLNISEAADVLFTSQPGISKQIRLLEEELGVLIFVRNGKRIVSVTEPGKRVVSLAENIMRQMQNIKKIGDQFMHAGSGELVIAAPHSYARYILPDIVARFSKIYPDVRLVIKQGAPTDLKNMVLAGEANFAVISEDVSFDSDELAMLVCGEWSRCLVVTENHPLLAKADNISLQEVISYPLITYDFAFEHYSEVYRAFRRNNLTPSVFLSAADSDVIKAYVRKGLGVGLVESMVSEETEEGLRQINVGHLFEPSASRIAIRKDAYLQGYVFCFIELFAPELNRSFVEEALYAPGDRVVFDDYVI